MVDFAQIAALVAETITGQGLGETITLTTVTPGTYDPATGAATPTTVTQTPDAIVEDFNGAELLTGLVQSGDKKVSIPAPLLTGEPKPTDTVTVGSARYTVERVTTDRAGGVAILYVLHCRRA